uniref:Uncharacterized protein n=1 Tax=Romanomermis culicivorax TaxID=13658 RepID=A0A915L0I3_ROMCU
MFKNLDNKISIVVKVSRTRGQNEFKVGDLTSFLTIFINGATKLDNFGGKVFKLRKICWQTHKTCQQRRINSWRRILSAVESISTRQISKSSTFKLVLLNFLISSKTVLFLLVSRFFNRVTYDEKEMKKKERMNNAKDKRWNRQVKCKIKHTGTER